MKVTFDSNTNSFVAEFEGEGHSSIWKQVAAFQEVFTQHTCGKCSSKDVRFCVRKATDASGKKEYLYHELRCQACKAKKAYGVIDDGQGSLFPKMKDEDGNWLKDNGWVKYNKETGKEE